MRLCQIPSIHAHRMETLHLAPLRALVSSCEKWRRGVEGVRKAHEGLSAASPWVPFGGQVRCHLPL